MKKRIFSIVFTSLSALLFILALFLFWKSGQPPAPVPPEESPAILLPPPAEEPSVPEELPVQEPETPSVEEPTPRGEPDDGLPTDKFFITAPRKKYTDGELQLIIPKLGVDTPVLDGTGKKQLRRGVGLYDYAQLPSERRSNTSIAGHRNQIYSGKVVLDQPFSYLDLLEEGDCLYLRDSEAIYQYVFEFQQVVTPDDWSPIYKTDHSCVTLTTCTPVGISDHRLVVRGKLVGTVPASEAYDYPSRLE